MLPPAFLPPLVPARLPTVRRAPVTRRAALWRNARRARVAPIMTATKEAAVEAPAFSWVEQWYPVCWEVDFDDAKPFPFQLWDSELVMFRNAADRSFVVLDDECAHRAAPLSEGRVVQREGSDGVETVLACNYHGWEFDCRGACVAIPQLRKGSPIPKTADMQKKYPTKVALGIVFVYYGDPENADKHQLPLPSHLTEADPEDLVIYQYQTRMLPYDILTLHENILDPAHGPWAHHNSGQGDRNEVRPGARVDVREFDLESGVMVAGARRQEEGPDDSTVYFSPPCMSSYHVHFPALRKLPGTFSFTLLGAPAGRGQTRLVSCRAVVKPSKKMRRTITRTPRWYFHTMTNIILDGDAPLLVGQERAMQSKQLDGYGGAWKGNHVLTEADGAVLAFRKWADVHAPDMPWRYPPSPLSTVERKSRKDLIDRYATHTKDCKSCSTALRRMIKLRSAALAIAALCGIVIVSSVMNRLLIRGGSLLPVTPFTVAVTTSLLLGSAMLALAKVLCRFIPLFGYTEVAHELNHGD